MMLCYPSVSFYLYFFGKFVLKTFTIFPLKKGVIFEKLLFPLYVKSKQFVFKLHINYYTTN